MRREFTASLLWVALVAVGCSTHETQQCFPECTAENQVGFARCVAYGNPARNCLAGNRMCCALAEDCIGPLDDQRVVTTQTCQRHVEAQCWPPCTEDDETLYDECVELGSELCGSGDENCCVEESDCIGSLADWYIEADGCCVDDLDCGDDERCDGSRYVCVPSIATGCGNGSIEAPEECDDFNDATEACDYGAMSCTVCGAGCVNVAGATSYCGDDVVDSTAGEECDPPGATCSTACATQVPVECTNGSLDGLETDVDCGGGECPRCITGQLCEVDSDCTTATPECSSVHRCLPGGATGGMLVCTDTEICSDGDACTYESCDGGCTTPAQIDDDLDGFGPGGPSCLGGGGDCDDLDRSVNPGVSFDSCDGVIDHNCDGTVDEAC